MLYLLCQSLLQARKVKQFAERHTANEKQSWDSRG